MADSTETTTNEETVQIELSTQEPTDTTEEKLYMRILNNYSETEYDGLVAFNNTDSTQNILYPVTRVENVVDDTGKSLDVILEEAKAVIGTHINGETVEESVLDNEEIHNGDFVRKITGKSLKIDTIGSLSDTVLKYDSTTYEDSTDYKEQFEYGWEACKSQSIVLDETHILYTYATGVSYADSICARIITISNGVVMKTSIEQQLCTFSNFGENCSISPSKSWMNVYLLSNNSSTYKVFIQLTMRNPTSGSTQSILQIICSISGDTITIESSDIYFDKLVNNYVACSCLLSNEKVFTIFDGQDGYFYANTQTISSNGNISIGTSVKIMDNSNITSFFMKDYISTNMIPILYLDKSNTSYIGRVIQLDSYIFSTMGDEVILKSDGLKGKYSGIVDSLSVVGNYLLYFFPAGDDAIQNLYVSLCSYSGNSINTIGQYVLNTVIAGGDSDLLKSTKLSDTTTALITATWYDLNAIISIRDDEDLDIYSIYIGNVGEYPYKETISTTLGSYEVATPLRKSDTEYFLIGIARKKFLEETKYNYQVTAKLYSANARTDIGIAEMFSGDKIYGVALQSGTGGSTIEVMVPQYPYLG